MTEANITFDDVAHFVTRMFVGFACISLFFACVLAVVVLAIHFTVAITVLMLVAAFGWLFYAVGGEVLKFIPRADPDQ